MPVYEMSCPKCGKPASEYAEDKWQCLSCQHKFIYKDESVVQHFKTTVNIENAPLIDLESSDPSCEQPVEQPYTKWHSLEEDAEWKSAIKRCESKVVSVAIYLGLTVLFGIIWGLCILTFIVPSLIAAIINQIYGFWWKKKAAVRAKYLSTLSETVGWTTLCPFCKAKHSQYFFIEKPPAAAPVHCTSCGKQFMLVNGHAFKFKEKKPTPNIQPLIAPAIIAEPAPATFIACPLCGIGIPLTSIRRGTNNCPSCKKEYVAE